MNQQTETDLSALWRQLLSQPPAVRISAREAKIREDRLKETIDSAESAFSDHPELLDNPLVVDAVSYFLEMDRCADLYNEAVSQLGQKGFPSLLKIYGYVGNGYDVCLSNFFYFLNHENRYIESLTGVSADHSGIHHTPEHPVKPQRATIADIRWRLGCDSSWTCFYCSESGTDTAGPDGRTWHVDHVYAEVNGGDALPDNFVLACATCNISKNKSFVRDFMMRLKLKLFPTGVPLA
jgi:5-methylcytosine-specific restriction endonuclease McrA